MTDPAPVPTNADMYEYLDALDRDLAAALRLAGAPTTARQALLANDDECGCDPREIWRAAFERK